MELTPAHSRDNSRPGSIDFDPGDIGHDPIEVVTPHIIKETSDKAMEQTRINMIDLYKNNKELFFLNQLFFSVQFFPHHSSELEEIQQNARMVDETLTNNSVDFDVSYTGMLYEHLGSAITIKSPQNETLLQPLEFVMGYKGPIEVLKFKEDFDEDPYIAYDGYRFMTQQFTKKRRGYARLIWDEKNLDWETMFPGNSEKSSRYSIPEIYIRRVVDDPVLAQCLVRAVVKNDDEEEEPVKLWCLDSKKYAKWFVEGFERFKADVQVHAKKDNTNPPFIKCTVKYGNVTHHQYYKPALHMGFWPDCAEGFLQSRRRRRGQAKLGREFKWPTNVNILQATEIGCDLEPLTKFEENTLKGKGLIWKISFSRVENYLLSTLTHAQLRCYLFLLLIIQDNCGAGVPLLKELLTNLLFQECEKDCLSWKEEQMGQKINLLLHKLYERLQNKHFESFFTKNRKGFMGMANEELLTMQNTISLIKQKPLYYSMKALRRLKNRYPSLDIKRLQAFLTYPGASLLKFINPQLPHPPSRRTSQLGANVILQGFRLEFVLEMFCKHYVDLAKSAISDGNVSQANMYAQAANNLCDIMAKDYKEKAEDLREKARNLAPEIEKMKGEKHSILDVLCGYVRKETSMEDLYDANTDYQEQEHAALERIRSFSSLSSPARSPLPSIGSSASIRHRFRLSALDYASSDNESIDSQDNRMFLRSSQNSIRRSIYSQDSRLSNVSYEDETYCQENVKFMLPKEDSYNSTEPMIETINPMYYQKVEMDNQPSQSSSDLCQSTQNCEEEGKHSDEGNVVDQKLSSEAEIYADPQARVSNNTFLQSTPQNSLYYQTVELDNQLSHSSSDLWASTQNWEEEGKFPDESKVVDEKMLFEAETHIDPQARESNNILLQSTPERPLYTEESVAEYERMFSKRKTQIYPETLESGKCYLESTEEEPLYFDELPVADESSLSIVENQIDLQVEESDNIYLQSTQEEPLCSEESTAVHQKILLTAKTQADTQTCKTDSSQQPSLEEELLCPEDTTTIFQKILSTIESQTSRTNNN